MKHILILIALLFSVSLSAQRGYIRPGIIGHPTDSAANLILGWNPALAKTQWMETSGGGDSIIITTDSICVIYLGDTICVSAASDSFYLSGDTSLCVISMGDTLCSPYSSAGTTIYTGNGAFPEFAARQVNMNKGSLLIDRQGASANGHTLFSQASLYPQVSIAGELLVNDQSSLLQLGASGTDGDVFMRFNGVPDVDYSFGVSRLANVGPLVISEGEELSNTGRQMIAFHGTGDSIVIQNDVLAGGSALRIRANTTAATGGSQKGLEVKLQGANAGQSTYAGFFNNIHTGAGASNYGVYSNASGAGSFNYGLYALGAWRGVYGQATTGAGVQGEATSTGSGVLGTSTSGAAVYGVSSSGYAIHGQTSSGSTVIHLGNLNTSTNTVVTMAELFRSVGSGVGADGVGGSIDFINEASDGNGYTVNRISSSLTTATVGSRTSQLMFSGVSSGASIAPILYLEGDKRVRFNGRSEEQQGADVASVAGAIALGYDGNTFEITGTNAITLISNIGWQNGSTITLLFTSTASLTDGTANSGTDIGFELGANTNFTGSAGSAITLKLSEIGGTQRWYEVSRSIN